MERKYEQLNKSIREFHKRGMLQEFLGMEDSFDLAVTCQYKNDKGVLVRCPHQWRVRVPLSAQSTKDSSRYPLCFYLMPILDPATFEKEGFKRSRVACHTPQNSPRTTQ